MPAMVEPTGAEALSQQLAEMEAALRSAPDQGALERLRIDYLGRNGALRRQLRSLGAMEAEARRSVGALLNNAQQRLTQALEERRSELDAVVQAQRLAGEREDLSLPGRGQGSGALHPVTQVLERIESLFTSMGFRIAQGPEIEDEEHNFTALNMPPDHPARAMHDTFYLSAKQLLRTHTSPVQIRVLRNEKPPLRVICPGRVYRRDFDISHTPVFHQVEGLWVDSSVNFMELKGVMSDFFRAFFAREKLPVRFRPSYFPFTEPSAEIDIGCLLCSGEGCRSCAHSGWLEVAGCGMVHPAVFGHCGLDAEAYNGFAFGMGVERLSMLHYGIGDLRQLYENDLRFLRQLAWGVQ